MLKALCKKQNPIVDPNSESRIILLYSRCTTAFEWVRVHFSVSHQSLLADKKVEYLTELWINSSTPQQPDVYVKPLVSMEMLWHNVNQFSVIGISVQTWMHIHQVVRWGSPVFSPKNWAVRPSVVVIEEGGLTITWITIPCVTSKCSNI